MSTPILLGLEKATPRHIFRWGWPTDFKFSLGLGLGFGFNVITLEFSKSHFFMLKNGVEKIKCGYSFHFFKVDLKYGGRKVKQRDPDIRTQHGPIDFESKFGQKQRRCGFWPPFWLESTMVVGLVFDGFLFHSKKKSYKLVFREGMIKKCPNFYHIINIGQKNFREIFSSYGA